MTQLAVLKKEYSLPQLFSVSKLSYLIKLKLEGVRSFQGVHVLGEITDYRTTGYVTYFSLKDALSIIRCVMFSPDLNFELQNGLEVIVLGSVSSYGKQSTYQLIITTIVPVGEGILALKLKQLKSKLSKEGLFDADCKLPLPRFPQTVGIITGKDSAAYGDILKTTKERFPHLTLVVKFTQVQGEGAADAIISAIESFGTQSIDILVLTRGGGGMVDLETFNNERLARAIFAFSKPVVTAIGHDRDIHIADMVADASFATPTAAMGNVLPHVDEYREQLMTLQQQLLTITDHYWNKIRQKKEKTVLYVIIGLLVSALIILLAVLI